MEDKNKEPIKKPTQFANNSECLCDELRKRCSGTGGQCGRKAGGRHVLCKGQRAKLAAIYNFKLCRAILAGFRKQMTMDGRCEVGMIGLQPEAERCDEMPLLHVGFTGAVYKVQAERENVYHNDLTSQLLDPVLVKEARRK